MKNLLIQEQLNSYKNDSKIITHFNLPNIRPNKIRLIHNFKDSIISTEHYVHSSQNFDGLLIAEDIQTTTKNHNLITELGHVRYFKDLIRETLNSEAKYSNQNYRFFDSRDGFEPNNISHLVNQLSPCVHFLNSNLKSDVVAITRRLNSEVFRKFCNFLEMEIWETSKTHHLNHTNLFATRGLSLYPVLNIFDVPAMSLLKEHPLHDRAEKLSFSEQPAEKNLFINRKDSRGLKNNREIVSLAREHGYSEIYLEDYEVEDQFRLIVTASNILTIHGAGMAFIPFNKNVKNIIEIFPPNVYHQWFPSMMSTQAANYIQVSPHYDLSVPATGWSEVIKYKNIPFKLDVKMLEYALIATEVGRFN